MTCGNVCLIEFEHNCFIIAQCEQGSSAKNQICPKNCFTKQQNINGRALGIVDESKAYIWPMNNLGQ